LKYQYLFRLVGAMSERLYETLTDQMVAFTGDLTDLKALIEDDHSTKPDVTERFSEMEHSLSHLTRKIERVQRLVPRAE
jgi:hypothetical protein